MTKAERKKRRKQWDKKYRDTHKEQEKQRHAKYRRTHRKELQGKAQEYHKANLAKRRAKSRNWIQNNSEKARRSTLKWRNKNAEMYRCCCAAQNANREAKKYNSPGKLTGLQLQYLFTKQKSICLRCKKRKQLGPDHVVSLSTGGQNTIENIQGLCAPCNKAKKDRCTDYRQ